MEEAERLKEEAEALRETTESNNDLVKEMD
jgi:hypothetical protein